MDPTLLPIIVPPIVVIALVVGFRWQSARGAAILKYWASDNGLELIASRKCGWFSMGPFSIWTTSRSQVVYAFQVRDSLARERSGWARCGSFWEGTLFSDRIEVCWQDAPEV